MGEAAEVVVLSYGSELRKDGAGELGEIGVRGANGRVCEADDEMKSDDRVGWSEGREAATLAGRVDLSDTAGELLRVEPLVKDEESETRSELLLCEKRALLVDGRRSSGTAAGEGERLVVELGGAASDIREPWARCLSLLMAAVGSAASEADRWGGVSRVGELTVARSITLGRPADMYDTCTAKSQILPLSKRAMLILRAAKPSFSLPSWMLRTSTSSHSESDESPSTVDRSSSDDR
jgi:hypothetical protein